MRLPSFRSLSPRQRFLSVAGLVLLGASAAFSVNAAGFDSVGGAIFLILSNVVMAMTKMFAGLTGIFISIMVVVARYNTFLNAPVVQSGWPIVRDLMNMMFIIALLIIAAGTVLRLQNYRYNRLLGKLIIMAFLVNFSKFIAVFLLQFAQVVMLTFVNAFRDAAFGNFSHMFGLDAVLNFANSQDFANQTTGVNMTIFISLVAGLAMMLVAFVVMLAITVMLFVRIIALWLLIIMSPLAYALRILPNTEGQAATWWREFTKYTILGPVLAFFLWISLALVGSGSCPDSNITCKTNPLKTDQTVNTAQAQAETDTATLREDFRTEVLSLDRLMTFIVGIIFLMMGLQYAQKSGAAGSAFAGKVATAGFGTAAALTGLSAIRDRTVAPVQGYFKERERRRNEAISKRTETLGMRVDQATNATIGQVGRLRAGATSAIGSTARGVGQVVTGQTTVRQAAAGVLDATGRGMLEGTQGYRQAKQRIAATQGKRNAATDAEFNMSSRSKDDLMAMALNSTMNGATRAAAARQLADNNQLQDDENGRTIADVASRSVQNIPDAYKKLKSTLAKNNPALLLSTVYHNWANGLADAQHLADDIERGDVSLDGFTPEIFARLTDSLANHQLQNGVGIDGIRLDPTNTDDVYLARQMASGQLFKQLAMRSKSQKQLNGWLSPLDKQTRKSLGDGAYFDGEQKDAAGNVIKNAELTPEQRKWVADEGNLEEAFHDIKRDASGKAMVRKNAAGKIIGIDTDYGQSLAEQYAVTNADKIVENAEAAKLSLTSVKSKDAMELLHSIEKVDEETIEKLTKDFNVAQAYAGTVGELMQDVKSGARPYDPTHDSSTLLSHDAKTKAGRQWMRLERGLTMGARGGNFKDSNGNEHNAVEEAYVKGYTGVDKTKAEDNLKRVIRMDGSKWKYFKTDPMDAGYANAADAGRIVEKFTKEVTVAALAKLSENAPDLVEDVMKDWKHIQATPLHPSHATVLPKWNKTATNDYLAGYR